MKTKRKNIFKSLLALTLALIMVLGVAPISELAGVDWASLFASKAEAIENNRKEVYIVKDGKKVSILSPESAVDIYSIIREKDADDSELEDLKDDIYDGYAYYTYDKDEFYRSITDAKVITVRVRVVGEEDSNILTSQVLLIREKGKWKIAAGAIDTPFFRN